MVHILDGNSEIDAHVRSNLCNCMCVRHLIRSRAIKKSSCARNMIYHLI